MKNELVVVLFHNLAFQEWLEKRMSYLHSIVARRISSTYRSERWAQSKKTHEVLQVPGGYIWGCAGFVFPAAQHLGFGV